MSLFILIIPYVVHSRQQTCMLNCHIYRIKNYIFPFIIEWCIPHMRRERRLRFVTARACLVCHTYKQHLRARKDTFVRALNAVKMRLTRETRHSRDIPLKRNISRIYKCIYARTESFRGHSAFVGCVCARARVLQIVQLRQAMVSQRIACRMGFGRRPRV